MTESHSTDRFSNLPNTTLRGMGSAQVLCLLPPHQVNPRAIVPVSPAPKPQVTHASPTPSSPHTGLLFPIWPVTPHAHTTPIRHSALFLVLGLQRRASHTAGKPLYDALHPPVPQSLFRAFPHWLLQIRIPFPSKGLISHTYWSDYIINTAHRLNTTLRSFS